MGESALAQLCRPTPFSAGKTERDAGRKPLKGGRRCQEGEETAREAVLQLQYLTPGAQVCLAHLSHRALAEQPREGETNRSDCTWAPSCSIELSLLPQLRYKDLPAQQIHSWATSSAENLPDPRNLPWETQAQALLYMEMHAGA